MHAWRGPPPEIATPAPDLPTEYLFAADSTTNANISELLPSQDSAYRDLADAALSQSPSLLEAVGRIEVARAGARRAGAERLPNLAADASIVGTRTNPEQFGGDTPFSQFIDTEQASYGANLTASWDADIFGRLRAQERAALARIDSATASAAAVRIALLAEIAGSVVDWRTLEARSAAIESDVNAAEELARLALTREEAGICPGL